MVTRTHACFRSLTAPDVQNYTIPTHVLRSYLIRTLVSKKSLSHFPLQIYLIQKGSSRILNTIRTMSDRNLKKKRNVKNCIPGDNISTESADCLSLENNFGKF